MNNAVVLVISADLPFAMSRFCGAEGLEQRRHAFDVARPRLSPASTASTSSDGPLKGLTARAVVVLDENNKVLHSELVPEIAQRAELRRGAGGAEVDRHGARSRFASLPRRQRRDSRQC